MLEILLGPIPPHLRASYVKSVDNSYDDGVISPRPPLYEKMKNNTDPLEPVILKRRRLLFQEA
jgi:hypothetical protein